VRLLTALAVIVMGGFATWQGRSILGFGLARAAFSPAQTPAVFRPWVATPGLAGDALKAMLARPGDPTDAAAMAERVNELNALLERQPLSSEDWLLLAGARFVAAKPPADVLSAFRLSAITGSHEGAIMLQRGIFGLVEWQALPPEFRERTIADLAGALNDTTVQDVDINPAKRILAAQSEMNREAIAALLDAEGVSPQDMKRLGLVVQRPIRR
jgi:hypothetical protein